MTHTTHAVLGFSRQFSGSSLAAGLVALVLGGWLGGCAQQQTPVVAPLSGIELANLDPTVKPGDDFFQYVNGNWLARTEIPADRPSYGGFSVLRDESQERVRVIIEESAAGEFDDGSDQQKVGDLYKSYLDVERRNAIGIDPLQPELQRIDAIENYQDLAVYFASAQRRGFRGPLALSQFADFKRPTHYGVYIFQTGLGLPDREYYLSPEQKFVEIRAAYVDYMGELLQLAGIPGSQDTVAQVMALETRLAEQQMKKEETRRWAKNYNKVPLSQLPELMPEFAWSAFLGEAQVTKVDGLIVIMTDYLKALDGIIQTTPIETWRHYLRWSALNLRASQLTTALGDRRFAFYGTRLMGTPEQLPLWRRGVSVVNATLGEVVGKVYVERHFPPSAKQHMLTLVENLTRAYEKSISELEWMTAATKAEAQAKLSKFTTKIGYPDVWRDYSRLQISANDLYGNLERATQAEYQRELDRQGGEVDRAEWRMTPQTVNAYYSPPSNEIVFPAGILQPPFFNPDVDDAVNYGAIGAVIGHEIGHGFDDSGSTFDGDGALRNWWSDADRDEFDKRTGRLVDQYSAYAPFPDLNVNGEFTLGENIGDLGGISIGLLAYKMSLDGKEPPLIDGFTGIQRVFLGYGQIWRQKTREEALRQRILTDPHSPARYRANGAVRNVPEFYEAFGVTESDALYLKPEDRVRIW